ncbi:MAG: tandem-95 repeat protein, partial [Actinobacteria bacterium]|nr:tandem-95 repeat protein [Actinomycetota bacterium]
LYPIAVSSKSLEGVAPGATVADVTQGTSPGNFGWLTWTGDNGVGSLVTSLTPPGDSQTYTNPDDPADHVVSVGDRVRGRAGVSNSSKVRDALDDLKRLDVVLPVWDQAAGGGSNATYRVSGFAAVRLLSYDLPRGRVSVRYIARASCTPTPVGQDVKVTTAEDTPVVVALSASTEQDSDLSFMVTAPAHGGLGAISKPDCTRSGGLTTCTARVTYTPPANYSGPDSFTFRAKAGSLESAAAAAAITVTPVNDPPAATPDSKSTDEGRVLSFSASDLTANDSPGPPDEAAQALTVEPVFALAGTTGTVALAGTTVTYTPAPGFSGTDTFGYRACDNGLTGAAPDPQCADSTVTVAVRRVNRAPVATDVDVTVAEDATAPLTLAATDPDVDPLTFTVVGPPAHGSLSGTEASRTYTPGPDFFGADSFTFRAGDGALDSNVATVRVVVTEVNDPPVAGADAKATDRDRPLSFPAAHLIGNDTPGPANEAPQSLTVTQADELPATTGQVALSGTTVDYVPAPGFVGTDSFGYRVCDNGTTAGVLAPLCADGTVTVDVSVPVNRPPVASDSAVTTAEDTALTVTPSVTDPDGDTYSLSVLTPPANGTIGP